MLAQKILHISVSRERSSDLVAAAKLQPLVSAVEIAVGQQQAIAKLRVGKKVAVVTAAM